MICSLLHIFETRFRFRYNNRFTMQGALYHICDARFFILFCWGLKVFSTSRRSFPACRAQSGGEGPRVRVLGASAISPVEPIVIEFFEFQFLGATRFAPGNVLTGGINSTPFRRNSVRARKLIVLKRNLDTERQC